MNDVSDSALEHVDERRRGFLGKLLTGGAAAAALPAMSTVAVAQLGAKGSAGGKGKGGKGKGDQAGKGKGGQAGKGKGGQGKGKGGQMDPKQMAQQWLSRFDKDGDKALNERELVAAFTEMAKRRGAGGGQTGPGQGKGKGQQPGQGKGKGKGQEQGSTGGGQKPKRPASE